MSDLISRQDAIDTLNKLADIKYTHMPYYVYYLGALHDAANDIKALPSVPERKKGRWIRKDDDSERYDSYWCDQCHHEITVDAKRFCDIGFVIEDFKFCLKCGAEMEGAER